MSKRLQGKTAIITGGAGGLGRAICMAFAAAGANVVVSDVGASREGAGAGTGPADAVVADIKKAGGNAIANYDSVTDFNASEKLIKTCASAFGRVDILINAHGNLRDRMMWNMSDDEWRQVIDVHLTGTFNTCRHASVVMKEQKWGRMINVTSDAWRGTVGHVNYGAAKGGIVSLTRAIARETGRFGVTCNAFAPIAATRMTMSEDVKAGFKKRLEGGLITKEFYDTFMAMPGPEHVPPFLIYLCTEEGANINGQVFHLEKGRIGMYSEPIESKAIYNDGSIWDVEHLVDLVPKTLLSGYVNPAPPEKEKK